MVLEKATSLKSFPEIVRLVAYTPGYDCRALPEARIRHSFFPVLIDQRAS